MRTTLLTVSLLLWTTFAHAVDTPRLLPQYTPCTHNGVRHACYTSEQQVELNLLEARLLSAKKQEAIYLSTEKLLEKTNFNLLQVVREYEGIQVTRQKHLEELTVKLMHEIELKNKYKAESEASSDWAIWVGGGLTLMAGSLLLGVYLSH